MGIRGGIIHREWGQATALPCRASSWPSLPLRTVVWPPLQLTRMPISRSLQDVAHTCTCVHACSGESAYACFLSLPFPSSQIRTTRRRCCPPEALAACVLVCVRPQPPTRAGLSFPKKALRLSYLLLCLAHSHGPPPPSFSNPPPPSLYLALFPRCVLSARCYHTRIFLRWALALSLYLFVCGACGARECPSA